MEAQMQHLTKVMQEMVVQCAEQQAQRLAVAETRADQAAQETANARTEISALHSRLQESAEAKAKHPY